MGGIQRLRARLAAWAAALCVVALSSGAPVALAELTVEDLTGRAVTGVGPFHQDVADAIQKFQTGDYRGALALLESAKKSTPRLPPPEVMMAQLYYDVNQTVAANAMLEQTIRKLPDDPEAYVMLAERAAAEGRMTEAGLLFEKIAPRVNQFTENPRRREDLQARVNSSWAAVDESNENWAAAQKKLEDLIRLDTRNAGAHHRLGRALFRQNKGEAAYAEFKLAAQADASQPPAELAMAMLFNDKAKAEEWLQHAIKLSGSDLRTQLAAGQYLVSENRIEEAQKHADEALKIDPKNLDANLLAGVIARLQSDNKTAERYLSIAHLLAPANQEITNHLALVLIELPDEASRQRALEFATLNARQHPDVIHLVTTLGWVNYRLNRKAEAKRALTSAFTATAAANNNQMNADMGYYLANLAKDGGNYPYAIQLLKNALNTNEPFVYRKPAAALLAQLEKLDAAAPKTRPTSATPGAGTDLPVGSP